METTNTYYNAKPSNIGNIGLDVSGAKRHNFDTYETTEEREKRKQANKDLKAIKEAIKSEILSDTVLAERLIQLYAKQFQLIYGFSPLDIDSDKIILERRNQARQSGLIADFNKMIRAYNTFNRDERRFHSQRHFEYYLKKLRAKYQPKHTFIEQSGKTFNWKEFNTEERDLTGKIDYLKSNSKAVQFGNSVSDKERGYILIELTKFLQYWQSKPVFKNINLMPISWSFGARGKAGSVAYYMDSKKLISVNRNNIGSLIHEIGHYIDHTSADISRKISFQTVEAYRESIKNEVSSQDLKYYCQRTEIFARAFEAYCFKIGAGFRDFAQCGKMALPELNEELIGLIKQALKI